ncbi:MAG: pectate lyase superfamily protein, partial [Firmicutes bacterium]|nr:pectate lyase superfamily protein [Bacillota bacterium]
LIENVYLDNNRRQGITVISAKNLTIKNSIITNTNGTNPYSGINFEPNFNTEFMTNVVVQNVQTMNNEGYGIYINGIDRLSTGPNANDVSVTIINHTDIGSLQGAISNMTAYTRNHVFFK